MISLFVPESYNPVPGIWVIGDSVNIAARLEQVAKGDEIIIGEKTYHQTQSHFHTQKKKEISVKNMAEPVVCYNVL